MCGCDHFERLVVLHLKNAMTDESRTRAWLHSQEIQESLQIDRIREAGISQIIHE